MNRTVVPFRNPHGAMGWAEVNSNTNAQCITNNRDGRTLNTSCEINNRSAANLRTLNMASSLGELALGPPSSVPWLPGSGAKRWLWPSQAFSLTPFTCAVFHLTPSQVLSDPPGRSSCDLTLPKPFQSLLSLHPVGNWSVPVPLDCVPHA